MSKKKTQKKGPVPLSERWKPSKPGTQRRKVHDLYETGMPLKDIAKKLKLEYGNVSGHVSNYREGHKLNGTDKTFNEKGVLVSKSSLKPAPKKKVSNKPKPKPKAKKKKSVKKPKPKVTVKKVNGIKVTTTVKQVSKKKAKELIKAGLVPKPQKFEQTNKPGPVPVKVNKPGPGTKVVNIPDDVEEVEEIEVDEFTGKPLF